jgi:Transposase IS4
MAEGTEFDPTDTGTLRPNAKPLQKRGTQFQPMECPEFDFQIRLPRRIDPRDAFALFSLYYTPEIIESMVKYTNSSPRKAHDPAKARSRANAWYPTCAKEIYTFFGIRIYMTVFPLNQIEEYWDTRLGTPFHYFTRYMSRDRFQELRMRYRTCEPQIKDIYERIIHFLLSPTLHSYAILAYPLIGRAS